MNGMNKEVICPIECADYSQKMNEFPISNPQMPLNAPYGSVFINPYTATPINAAVTDKRFMDALIKMEEEKLKAQLDIEKQKLDYAYKRDLEMLKTENRLRIEEKQAENITKRIKGMQARTQERENAAYAIFKDSESRLRLETKYPTRKSEYSEPVISCVDMRACRICDVETHKTVVIIVEADKMTEKIVLVREEVNARVFEHCLSERGLAVTTSRERRKLVLELLLSFLVDEAVVIELPKTVGWSKTNTGWIFAESDAKTIEGVIRGRYEIE